MAIAGTTKFLGQRASLCSSRIAETATILTNQMIRQVQNDQTESVIAKTKGHKGKNLALE